MTTLAPIPFHPAADEAPCFIDIADYLRAKLRTTGGAYHNIDYITTETFDELARRIEDDGWELQIKMGKSDHRAGDYSVLLSTVALYTRDDTLLSVFLTNQGTGDFYVWDPDIHADLLKMLDGILGGMILPRPKVREDTPIQFSFRGPGGAIVRSRYITTPRFDEIAHNYPSEVRPKLAQLAGMNLSENNNANGRVIILHGPPGTGKTTLLRGFAREWRDWATIRYIVDPDVLFNDATYLYSLLEDRERDKWGYILLLEDVDDFIGASARTRTGQAFSRLLNLADGFLGQGLNMLLVMTTNKKLDDIEPALRRQGRCMANVLVGNFGAPEASEWLGRTVNHEMTLAQLYEAKGNIEQVTVEKARVRTGTYL